MCDATAVQDLLGFVNSYTHGLAEQDKHAGSYQKVDGFLVMLLGATFCFANLFCTLCHSFCQSQNKAHCPERRAALGKFLY